MSDHDGHTINVGPVTIGEPLAVAEPIDLDAVREQHRLPDGDDDDVGEAWCRLCFERWPCTAVRLADEIDRLRATIAALVDLVADTGAHR